MYMKFWKVSAFLLFFCCCSLTQQAQTPFRVLSYNVENLFDTVDDPEKDDDEFLPESRRKWTESRYYNKLQHLSKAIIAAGEWDMPALVGLCEVENDSTLHHLIRRTPLKEFQYRFCLGDGTDTRGINVGLLYQREKFKYIHHESLRIPFRNQEKKSRDILHVWGEIGCKDTLDVFVCHFPSRSGGEIESEPERMDAASALRIITDSIYRIRQTPSIVIMGDFNDEPSNNSIRKALGAISLSEMETHQSESLALINLFGDADKINNPGTYKYRNEWNLLDQMIVNQEMITRQASLYYKAGSAQIVILPFLITEDSNNDGFRPKRTYRGPRYEGGTSDHLPIMADFEYL